MNTITSIIFSVFILVTSVAAESDFLSGSRQLTFPNQFAKAGEAYFSPDGSKVVFQAVERVGDEETEDPFYAMFVADLVEGPKGPNLENIVRVSPPGSANTCGWFDPVDPDLLWFASTVGPPTESDAPGYQRGSGRYRWMFPPQMRIVKVRLNSANGSAESLEVVEGDGTSYVAECSVSPNGEYLLYCSLATGQGDIYVKNLSSGEITPLVTAPGYDGGPFFSPDGERICYRSDRHGNNMLQIFVADLERGDDGEFIGISREYQLTDNAHVNWCPFWHPDGKHLVYATSEMGHRNYEVFIVDAMEDDGVMPAHIRYGTAQRRVTDTTGADVLPAFDSIGMRMMWTSQQDPSGTSQLWIADFAFPEHRPSAKPSGAYGRGG